MFKINIFDRKYEKYEITSFLKEEKVISISIDPIANKLFHNDHFTLSPNTNNQIQIIKSPVRETAFFAGILVLTGNKTYGRKNASASISVKKHDKLLYKCIPNDSFLPSFLIPYEMKTMGFSKQFTNIYVIFKFDHWSEKHPHGILLQNIGPVNELPNFYEYQMYCKNLHHSINKFEKETTKSIIKISDSGKELFDFIQEKYNYLLEDRTNNNNVFTIDPVESIDFDDGFSIQTIINNNINNNNDFVKKTYVLLSIYISNVPLLLDALQLWSSFGERISTIYLPDKKRSMLPSMLGDNLCSLQEKKIRFAFTMDVYLEISDEIEFQPPIQIKKIEFKNTIIKVKKNYVYEETNLHKNLNYQLLLDVTKRLCQQQQKTDTKYLPEIKDSHDVIAYLMIWMNHECSKKFLHFNNGIFRSSSENYPKVSPIIQEKNSLNLSVTIKELFANQVGKYLNKSKCESYDDLRHNALDLDSYIHITSPIRRLVDLLNMIQFQENLKMIYLSNDAQLFYQRWIDKIDQINRQMKDIRRVQNQCSLLELCINDPLTIEKKYEGFVFEKKEKELGLYSYHVFLTDLKIIGKIVTDRLLEDNNKYLFQLYVFNDEETFKKKIRLNLIL